MNGIRRVVTGHDADGKAVFASDGIVEPLTARLVPGAAMYSLWGADTPPHFPDDGAPPAWRTWFPPAGGFRFGVITIPPDATTRPLADVQPAELEEMEARFPGALAAMEPDHPGMHTTASVDMIYVISGRVIVELDRGATKELGPGDTLVQNGTRHAWRNPFDEPCVTVSVQIGVGHERA